MKHIEKCPECYAHHNMGNNHVCDPLMRMIVSNKNSYESDGHTVDVESDDAAIAERDQILAGDEQQIDVIVFDLETTGFVAPEAKILEIAAFIFYKGQTEPFVKHWMLNHGIDIPEKITQITGITKEMIDAEGTDPKQCIIDFISYLTKASRNVTHNGMRFDIPFLVNSAEDTLKMDLKAKQQLFDLLETTAFDTAVAYKAAKFKLTKYPTEPYAKYAERVLRHGGYGACRFNLGHCCDDMKVDRTNITQHRALGDVALTSALYQKMI